MPCARTQSDGFGSITQTAVGDTPDASHPANMADPIFPQPNRTSPRRSISEYIEPPIKVWGIVTRDRRLLQWQLVTIVAGFRRYRRTIETRDKTVPNSEQHSKSSYQSVLRWRTGHRPKPNHIGKPSSHVQPRN